MKWSEFKKKVEDVIKDKDPELALILLDIGCWDNFSVYINRNGELWIE